MNISPVYTFKKLNFLYTVHDTYTAGIMLEGWEAVALNEHCGSIDTAYCMLKGKNFLMINSKITPLKNQRMDDIVSKKEVRDRVLLLNKTELNRIQDKIKIKGFTCVPVKLYRNSKHLWKLDIALVTGKKNWDRRDDIKKKDVEREMKRDVR